MGIARAGFHGTVGQPSAQVIDGSLLFDGSSTYLKRTPSSSGNRRTFTISLWAKYSKNQTSDQFWAGTGINDNWRVRGNSDGDVRLKFIIVVQMMQMKKQQHVLEILDGIILYMQLIQHRAQQTIDKKFM